MAGDVLDEIRPEFLLGKVTELRHREQSGLKYHSGQVQIPSLCPSLEVFAISIIHTRSPFLKLEMLTHKKKIG